MVANIIVEGFECDITEEFHMVAIAINSSLTILISYSYTNLFYADVLVLAI